MSEFQEGYNDGLAGVGMQEREEGEGEFSTVRGVEFLDYGIGFIAGSLDRKTMLAAQKAEQKGFNPMRLSGNR